MPDVLKHEEFQKLQDFCLEIIGWEPSIIFKSKDFYDLSEYVLSIILKQDFLQISEIEIWDHLIKWGIHKSKFSDLDNDINYWDLKKEDLFELEKILHDLIPLIRFLEFNIDDCCEKIKPLKDILPLEIKHELWNYHKYPKIELDHILPIRSPILNNFESKLLNRDQINKFKKFIYKNDDFEFLISRPKQRSSHYTIYDDPNAGPSFGINDLRFYKQFSSESNNCCAIPTVFETKIINETEFLVEDYEVYQIYLDSDLKNL
ncbi:7788_t:CDS:2, partial [Entrophospora sp. SA101]